MKIYTKAILVITLIVTTFFLLVETVMPSCFPQAGFEAHWAVALYFWIFYSLAVMFVNKGMTGIAFTRYFIGLKAAKLFLSLCFVAVLAYVVREKMLAAVVNFFVYYILLLVPECAFGIYMKKHLK